MLILNNSEYCEVCECDPCDCGWGNYIILLSYKILPTVIQMKKNKQKSKKKSNIPKKRNWIAVHAFQRSGAGPHESKKYSRKIKHKNKKE
jgi:hypothetical protein